jgi:hypothetical protein
VQLVSNFKGVGAERATYTVRVKPGASHLADMTCDCSLRLGTEYKILYLLNLILTYTFDIRTISFLNLLLQLSSAKLTRRAMQVPSAATFTAPRPPEGGGVVCS